MLSVKQKRIQLLRNKLPREKWFERSLDKLGIEGFRCQWWLAPYFVDYVWRQNRIIVELGKPCLEKVLTLEALGYKVFVVQPFNKKSLERFLYEFQQERPD